MLDLDFVRLLAARDGRMNQSSSMYNTFSFGQSQWLTFDFLRLFTSDHLQQDCSVVCLYAETGVISGLFVFNKIK